MAKNKAGRAWRILRMALLWARKGGAFRRWRLMIDLRVALKSLRAGGGSGAHTERRNIRYMERQLSFDETPAPFIHCKMRFPKIPCMTAPSVRLDDDEDWIFFRGEKECDFFRSQASESEESEDVEVEEVEEEEELGIDIKAEEFITKFYEEMKLQREVSWREYNNEILNS